MTSIVQLNVSETLAPTPSTLQRTGAFVSHGGTTLTAGTYQLLSASTDLASILTAPAAISSLSWATGTVTVTTASAHGYTNADVVNFTIAGAAPTGYNGTFACTITGTDTFTYALVSDPGVETSPGTYVPVSATEVSQMNTAWFAQGSTLGVYVLELGKLGDVSAIAALSTYLTNNPNTAYTPGAVGYFYAYCVPRSWAGESTYITLVGNYTNGNAMTYFFTPMTTSNYTSFTSTLKSVWGHVEAPTITATEYDAAADMFDVLIQNPSSTNKVPPFAFTYQFGVTAYPLPGNSTTLASLKTAGVNVVGTGAEGGISNLILLYGTTMDTKSFNWWYAIDWTVLNENIALSNAVINGSNNNLNPMYYNQAGINSLQTVGAGILNNAVTYGLLLGQVIQTELDPVTFQANVAAGLYAGNAVINAVPFTTYVAQNPNDYAAGKYAGFSIGIVPQLGFEQIIINLNATQFA